MKINSYQKYFEVKVLLCEADFIYVKPMLKYEVLHRNSITEQKWYCNRFTDKKHRFNLRLYR